MLIDAIVIAVTYVLAWMIRFIGPFAYSAVRALAFEEYMFALIFIIPGYLLLYQAFTLYEPLHMQGRRLVLANIIKANVLGLLLIVFSPRFLIFLSMEKIKSLTPHSAKMLITQKM